MMPGSTTDKDSALLEKNYKRFVIQFALRGLEEWKKLVNQTEIGGNNANPDSTTAKAAGAVGAGVGVITFFTSGINVVSSSFTATKSGAAEMESIACKADFKSRLAKLESAIPSQADHAAKTLEFAKFFLSVGIELGNIFQKLITEAERVVGGWEGRGVDKLAQDAIERGIKHFTGLDSIEDLCPVDRFLYSVIYGKSSKKSIVNTRGGTIKPQMNLLKEVKTKLRLSTVETLNTHKGFGRARPVVMNEDGKWICYKKKGKNHTRQITHRRLADFEKDGIKMTKQFLSIYFSDDEEIGDPQFLTLYQDKNTFQTLLLNDLRKNHPSLLNSELIDLTRKIDQGVGNIENFLAGTSHQEKERLFYFGTPSTIFKGRSEELLILRESLQKKEEERRHILLISGLGGIGKTQLAIQFASKVRNDTEFSKSSCFFLNAETGQTLKDNLRQICNLLDIVLSPENSETEESKIIKMFTKLLSKVPKLRETVVILDNIDEFMLPPIRLQELRVCEAEALVREILKDFLQSQPAEETNIPELCRVLDRHTLSLKQAAFYIKREGRRLRGYSIAEYLTDFKSHLQKLKLLDFQSDNSYGKTMWTVFSITFGKIGESARRVLRLAMFLSEQKFGIEELVDLSKTIGNDVAGNVIRDLDVLRDHNIIEVDSRTYITVHKLIQDITRIYFEEQLWEDAKSIVDKTIQFSLETAAVLMENGFNDYISSYSIVSPAVCVVREVIRICKVREEKGRSGATEFINKHRFSLLVTILSDKEDFYLFHVLRKVLPWVKLNNLLYAAAVEQLICGHESNQSIKDSCEEWWVASFAENEEAFSTCIPEIPDWDENFGNYELLRSLNNICLVMFNENARKGDVESAQRWWDRLEAVENQGISKHEDHFLKEWKYFDAHCAHCEGGNFEIAFTIAKDVERLRKAGEKIEWKPHSSNSLYIARALVRSNKLDKMEGLFSERNFNEAFRYSLNITLEGKEVTTKIVSIVRIIQDCLEIVGPVVSIGENFKQFVTMWREKNPNAFKRPVNVDGKLVTVVALIELIYDRHKTYHKLCTK